jgi:hypothetical protein
MVSEKRAGPAACSDAGETRSPRDHAAELIEWDIPQHLRKHQERVLARQLMIFSRACRRIAVQVNVGAISFIDGVDFLYSAALETGLVAVAGDDRVQGIMSAAFRVRRS